MERIDFGKNSRAINDAYTKIVNGDAQISFAVFGVDAHNVFDIAASGAGNLNEFVEEFRDGAMQFGLARTTVPGSDVSKNILLGWCPDNAPVKMRLSFAPTFVEVAKIFAGYHIQITARDSDDLDVNEIISKVGAAAGARYTYHAGGHESASVVPPPMIKPSSPITATNKNPRKISGNTKSDPNLSTIGAPKLISNAVDSSADDGWGDEKAILERDLDLHPLEDTPSAYIPTKVDIKELRKQKSDTTSSQALRHEVFDRSTSDFSQQGQMPSIESFESKDERLTSIPKPKISNVVSARFPVSRTDSSSTPKFGSKPVTSISSTKVLPTGVFQNHANEHGLSPAQAWAQKRGKYVVGPTDEAEVEDRVGDLLLRDDNEVSDIRMPFHRTDCKDNDSQADAMEPAALTESDARKNGDMHYAQKEPTQFKDVQFTNSEVGSSKKIEKGNEQDNISVEILEEEKPPTLENEEHSTAISAKAQYDYEKDEENEISFQEGDSIIEIEFADEEWWSGKNLRTGETGVFPGSYVSLNDTSKSKSNEKVEASPTQQDSIASGKSAIAEYDYEKEEDNEIGFHEGDLIVDIKFVDEDWWSGKHSVTGEIGVFPGNFVALQ